MTDPSPITVAPLLKDADDAGYMHAALDWPGQGLDAGEVPVGAPVVCSGEIVGRGFNQPISSPDTTAHAEVMALRDAAAKLEQGLNSYKTLVENSRASRFWVPQQ
jgi:tRNA(Arg) A34 adenosine deaminase TadA